MVNLKKKTLRTSNHFNTLLTLYQFYLQTELDDNIKLYDYKVIALI